VKRVPTAPPPAPPPVVPPPPDAKRYGGGRPGWTLLCTVGDLYEAHLVKGVLEESGLGPVVLQPVPMFGAWMLPSGHERVPQRVFVPTAVEEAAQLALLEAGLDEIGDEEALAASTERLETEPLPSPFVRERRLRWMLGPALVAALVSIVWLLLRGNVTLP